ncbi:MAG: hypothetical protein KKH94_10070 [Candidatus Omnitrophica bacterium]|nr:hypothetical protein [Candidatus Omnitrophota bacterium]
MLRLRNVLLVRVVALCVSLLFVSSNSIGAYPPVRTTVNTTTETLAIEDITTDHVRTLAESLAAFHKICVDEVNESLEKHLFIFLKRFDSKDHEWEQSRNELVSIFQNEVAVNRLIQLVQKARSEAQKEQSKKNLSSLLVTAKKSTEYQELDPDDLSPEQQDVLREMRYRIRRYVPAFVPTKTVEIWTRLAFDRISQYDYSERLTKIHTVLLGEHLDKNKDPIRFNAAITLGMAELYHEYLHWFINKTERKKIKGKRIYGHFDEFTVELFIVLKEIEFLLAITTEQDRADLLAYLKQNRVIQLSKIQMTVKALICAITKGESVDSIIQDISQTRGLQKKEKLAQLEHNKLIAIVARYLKREKVTPVYKPQFNAEQFFSLAEEFNNMQFFGPAYGIQKQKKMLREVIDADDLTGKYYDTVVIVVEEKSFEPSKDMVYSAQRDGLLPRAAEIVFINAQGEKEGNWDAKFKIDFINPQGEKKEKWIAKHKIVVLAQPDPKAKDAVKGNWSALLHLIQKLGLNELYKQTGVGDEIDTSELGTFKNIAVILSAGTGSRNMPMTASGYDDKGKMISYNSQPYWYQTMKQIFQSYHPQHEGVFITTNDGIKADARDIYLPDQRYHNFVGKQGIQIRGAAQRLWIEGKYNPELEQLGTIALNPDGTIRKFIEKPTEKAARQVVAFMKTGIVPTNWADYFLDKNMIRYLMETMNKFTNEKGENLFYKYGLDTAGDLFEPATLEKNKYLFKKIKKSPEEEKAFQKALNERLKQQREIFDAQPRDKIGTDWEHFVRTETERFNDEHVRKQSDEFHADWETIWKIAKDLQVKFGMGYINAGSRAIFIDTGNNRDFYNASQRLFGDSFVARMYRQHLDVSLIMNDVVDKSGHVVIEAGALVGPNVIFDVSGDASAQSSTTVIFDTERNLWQLHNEDLDLREFTIEKGALVGGWTKLTRRVKIESESVVINAQLELATVVSGSVVHTFKNEIKHFTTEKDTLYSGVFIEEKFVPVVVGLDYKASNTIYIKDAKGKYTEYRDEKGDVVTLKEAKIFPRYPPRGRTIPGKEFILEDLEISTAAKGEKYSFEDMRNISDFKSLDIFFGKVKELLRKIEEPAEIVKEADMQEIKTRQKEIVDTYESSIIGISQQVQEPKALIITSGVAKKFVAILQGDNEQSKKALKDYVSILKRHISGDVLFGLDPATQKEVMNLRQAHNLDLSVLKKAGVFPSHAEILERQGGKEKPLSVLQIVFYTNTEDETRILKDLFFLSEHHCPIFCDTLREAYNYAAIFTVSEKNIRYLGSAQEIRLLSTDQRFAQRGALFFSTRESNKVEDMPYVEVAILPHVLKDIKTLEKMQLFNIHGNEIVLNTKHLLRFGFTPGEIGSELVALMQQAIDSITHEKQIKVAA